MRGLRNTALFAPENQTPSTLPLHGKSDLSDTGLEDQSVLLPAASQGLAGFPWFFQKRVNLFASFRIYAKDSPTAPEFELLKRDSFLFDGATHCPLSNEVLVLGPGLHENGTPFTNGKARRIYIYSLDTRTTTPLWKMEKDDKGQIVAPVSASPDCKHLLVNLRLETEQNRTPYGRLLYVRNEPGRTGELPSARIGEVQPQGYLKGFAQATFVLPPDPRYYKSSQQPPQAFAIQEYPEDRDGPLRAFLYAPSRTGMGWKRDTVEVPGNVASLSTPVFYNRLDNGFAIATLRETHPNGVNKTALAALGVEGTSTLSLLGESGAARILSLGIHPSGQRLAAAFVLADANANDKAKPLPAAGVMEITTTKEGRPNHSLVESFGPFHALGAHHNPRPQYTADGQWLIYAVPSVSDGADPKIFDPASRVDSGLQFPTRLVQWRLQ